MYLTYKYRLLPNKYQRRVIDETIDCANVVRNLCIQKNEKNLVKKNAKFLVNKYISEHQELKKTDYSALINALFNLIRENNKYQSDRSTYSSTYSDFLKTKFPLSDKRIFLPKVGWMRYIRHRNSPTINSIYRITVKRNKLDEYYVYLECEIKEETKSYLDIDNSIGLDYSSTHFLIGSDGNKFTVPHYYRDVEKKKKELNKELSRKTAGSVRYKECMNKILKLEEHTKNLRHDTIHKLTSKLSEKYDYIFVETLDMKKISTTGHLSKATYDNAYALFLDILDYKMKKRGKKLVKINKWYPSSKTCSNCGYIYRNLKLSTRKWKCPNCGIEHDRDINAAKNIKKEGISMLTAG